MRSERFPFFHLESYLKFPFTFLQVVARHRSALICLAVIAAYGVFPAHGAGTTGSDKRQLEDSYAAMCVKAVKIPAAHGGEGDLKGNAKLPEYCKCFAGKFLERAMKPSPGAPASMEQTMAEEYAMRQSCRTQFSLPLPPKA